MENGKRSYLRGRSSNLDWYPLLTNSLDIVYPIARASTGRNAIEAPNWKSTGIPSTNLGVETVDDLQSWKARSI